MSAVAADEKQDYATALANYRQTLAILRAEVAHAPQEDQPAFQDRVSPQNPATQGKLTNTLTTRMETRSSCTHAGQS
jgi:hypothetical protein